MMLPQDHRVVKSDVSSDLEELPTPVIRKPRSDMSYDSKLKIFTTHPIRRSDISSDEDDVS